MNFHGLPVELQLDVVKYLGPQFFREDVRRLCVSKAWYNIAFPVFAAHLYLPDKILNQPTPNDQWYKRIFRIRPYITTVEFCMDLYRNGVSVPRIRAGPDSQLYYNAWQELNDSLSRIEWPLRRLLWRPWHLVIKGRVVWLHRTEPRYSKPYITLDNLEDLIFLEHLTSLDLDLSVARTTGQRLKNFGAEGGIKKVDVHLCQSIGSILPSLRRFRCRMDVMCPAILQPGDEVHDDGEGDENADARGNENGEKGDNSSKRKTKSDTPLLALEEVIVHTGVVDMFDIEKDSDFFGPDDPFMGHYHAYACVHTSDTPTSDARLEKVNILSMEKMARRLACRMRNPRMVRVLSYTGEYPDLHTQAFDALTGQHLELEMDAAWDAKGTVIKEVDESAEGL